MTNSATFALGAAAVLLLTTAGLAASPPRVDGLNCKTLSRSMPADQIWSTTFYGQRQDIWGGLDRYFRAPCFTSQASCTAWLYWAQTDWPEYNQWKPCHRGRPR